MATVASEVLAEARALLNDLGGAIYGDTTMIPLANKVYRELQTKLSANGIATTKELSAVVPVLIGTVKLADGAGLPIDLLYPLTIRERARLATTLFQDMDELDWEPDITLGPNLLYWNWREEEIKFPGALTDREVIIKYVKSLGSITGVNSPILILNSVQWLGQRLASIAALTIGANPTRATALSNDLVPIWDDLRATLVKRKQAIPVRRKRTRYRVP